MTCIYCKKQFSNAPPEHFIPQCIGGRNADTIKCVCSVCNHQLGSEVDALIRRNVQLSMAIDSSTVKKLMELETDSGIEKRKVKIVNGKTNELKYDNRSKNGPLRVNNIKFTIKPEEDLKLYKVFSKILLGFIAYQYGADEALKPQYDSLRAFITSSIEHPTGIEFKQLAPIFFRDDIRERINKISFNWDIGYDESVKQVMMKHLEVKVNYKIDKDALCNFVSLSNYDNNSIVGSVTILEKKSAMIILKNCFVSESGSYFHVFNKNEA